jgi:hypothetical protein
MAKRNPRAVQRRVSQRGYLGHAAFEWLIQRKKPVVAEDQNGAPSEGLRNGSGTGERIEIGGDFATCIL